MPNCRQVAVISCSWAKYHAIHCCRWRGVGWGMCQVSMQAKVSEMFLCRTAHNNLRPLKRYDDLVRCITSQAFWGHLTRLRCAKHAETVPAVRGKTIRIV